MLTRRGFAGFFATTMLTSGGLARSAAAQAPSPQAPSPQAPSPQAWPTRHVRLIVPFVPGGGAGANIGAQVAAASDPDGYTLYITSVPHATHRSLYPSLNSDPIADFAPVTLICTQSNIMVVPNSSPAKSVLEFVAYAKANPGKISYGSGGIGTSVHLSGELFKRMAGIEMTHVPYRG